MLSIHSLVLLLCCFSWQMIATVHCSNYQDPVMLISLHNTLCMDGSIPWIDGSQICCSYTWCSAFCCEQNSPFTCFIKRRDPPMTDKIPRKPTGMNSIDFYTCKDGYFPADGNGVIWCCPEADNLAAICCKILVAGPAECHNKKVQLTTTNTGLDVRPTQPPLQNPPCDCQKNKNGIASTATPKPSGRQNFRAMNTSDEEKQLPALNNESDSDSSAEELSVLTTALDATTEEMTTTELPTEMPDDLVFEACRAKGLATFHIPDNDTLCCVGKNSSQCCLEGRPAACSTDEFGITEAIDGLNTDILDYSAFEHNCHASEKNLVTLTAWLKNPRATGVRRFMSVTLTQKDECDVRVLMSVKAVGFPIGNDYAVEVCNKTICRHPSVNSKLLLTFPMNTKHKTLQVPSPVFALKALRGQTICVSTIDVYGLAGHLACGHLA
ncbi:Hypothetical predicted protein [Cloeon dipterum]|uniref:WAP domain-containing protein n=1 Tax=Cloeon dipterum TaxID=197152 RepID=A0A8S1CCD7_9INSE|nr:Hypothetical predicted protein [Cloeon dipterum]